MHERFRVRLCASCPYSAADLEDLYDANSEFLCCGTCPETAAYKTPGLSSRDSEKLLDQGLNN